MSRPTPTFARLAAACGLLLALAQIACGSARTHTAPRTTRPTERTLRLPKGTYPGAMTFAQDGSLWVSESSGNAIAQIDPAGRIRQYRIGTDDASAGDLVQGPDGAIWFAGFELIGRVVPGGPVTGYQDAMGQQPLRVGLPDALTRGPDGELWYTNEAGPQITRLTTDGQFSGTHVPSDEAGLRMPGIATGPDAAVWFTEEPFSAGVREAIGRVGLDGSYRQWPLPHRSSGPAGIAAGPDGALWFTERSGYRIGRITTEGTIAEFPLPPGTAPSAIVAGPDRALWFITDTDIGRITTEGRSQVWHVPGARSLSGIVADPRGGFWVADGSVDTLRHVDPMARNGP